MKTTLPLLSLGRRPGSGNDYSGGENPPSHARIVGDSRIAADAGTEAARGAFRTVAEAFVGVRPAVCLMVSAT